MLWLTTLSWRDLSYPQFWGCRLNAITLIPARAWAVFAKAELPKRVLYEVIRNRTRIFNELHSSCRYLNSIKWKIRIVQGYPPTFHLSWWYIRIYNLKDVASFSAIRFVYLAVIVRVAFAMKLKCWTAVDYKRVGELRELYEILQLFA